VLLRLLIQRTGRAAVTDVDIALSSSSPPVRRFGADSRRGSDRRDHRPRAGVPDDRRPLARCADRLRVRDGFAHCAVHSFAIRA
jgi:hypothetical protein